MSGTRAYYIAFVGFLAAFVLTACSEAPSRPLRVGLDAWPGFALLFIAQDKGFFEEQGVEVELVELSSLADVRRAFERGQIDGMATSLIEVLEASRNGPRNPVIALMTDYSNGGDVVLASTGIDNTASLKGRRVGIEPGTLNRFVLTRALEKAGLRIDDVEVVNIPQQAMVEVAAMGKVDALVTYPPVSTEIERSNLMRPVFSSAEIPGEVADVVSFDRELFTTRSADIAAFSRAWGQVVEYVRAEPEAAYALVSRHIDMSPDELATTYEGIEIISADREAQFVSPNGPLVDGFHTLSEILWPDDRYEEADWADKFFSRRAKVAWGGTE
ncbi:ABC transporter substrate-binding protein [Parvibaculaceae bacterium PLY_AMNH_Bact1]|nr:ABC transporter substrate-binding protein [Parvibaculaceae bacterium PLY_AMNH_Bact1]